MPKIVVQKTDWIKLGYKLFAETGISGIVIEKMSKKLNCNKSSFYWHFKTKKEFVFQLALFWLENQTKSIIALTSAEATTKQKLDKLIQVTYKKMPYLDFVFYLKRYAVKEARVLMIIDKVDSLRVNYVYKLLKEAGYTTTDAKLKSSILYRHLIGYHEMMRYKDQNQDYLEDVKKEINQIITF
jgi:AcrR family transcriptional regulator